MKTCPTPRQGIGIKTTLAGMADLVSRGRDAPYLRARAGQFPHCWQALVVRDLSTGALVEDVFEVDCTQRWLTRFTGEVVDGEPRKETLIGDYRLEYKSEATGNE
jgi:hypothetical protein